MEGKRPTSSLLVSSFPLAPFPPFLVGLPGSDTPSLSDMLGLLPLCTLLPLCWNWTFRRGLAIALRADRIGAYNLVQGVDILLLELISCLFARLNAQNTSYVVILPSLDRQQLWGAVCSEV